MDAIELSKRWNNMGRLARCDLLKKTLGGDNLKWFSTTSQTWAEVHAEIQSALLSAMARVPPLKTGTLLDGFEWEVTIHPNRMVDVRRTLDRVTTRGSQKTLQTVAVGYWDGEKIKIARHFSDRGEPCSDFQSVMLCLSDMLRIELQP